MTTDAKAALRAEFPGWSIIWTRDTGRWWATRTSRRAELNGVVRRADLVTEAAADSAEELRAALREISRQDAVAK